MDNERLKILLSNILGELYTKTFDCNGEEFNLWLKTEIGFTDREIINLTIDDRFPKEAGALAFRDIYKAITFKEDKE